MNATPELNSNPVSLPNRRGPSWPLGIGAALTCGGICACILGAELSGGLLTLSGAGIVVWNLHRLGRSGPD